MTALKIAKAALRLIGVKDFKSDDSSNALEALNMLLNSWAARGILSVALIRESFSLAADQTSYTIGSGQTLDSSKPNRITSAFLRDSNSNDSGIGIITREVFDSYADKTVTGPPNILFYDPGATQQATQVGEIYLYPRADVATYTLYIEAEKPWTEFSKLDATSTFPNYFDRAMKFNLAIEVAAEHRKSVSQEVAKGAKESLDIIIRLNARLPVSNTGLPVAGGGNILTGV